MAGKISFAAALVLLPFSVSAQEDGPVFVRGDANGDGVVDISDALRSLWCLFLLGDCFGNGDCADAADANDNGTIDLTDPIHTLGFLFLGATRPADPFPYCGPDSTTDDLGCWRYDACPEKPHGDLVADSGCLDPAGGGASGSECIEWSFEEEVLKVVHRGSPFICNAAIRGWMSVDADRISVYEVARIDGEPVPCMCLHDLEFEAAGVPSGAYEVRVISVLGDVWHIPEDIRFETAIDIGSEPSGSVCHPHDEYPWVR
jgi:hypothetical protein